MRACKVDYSVVSVEYEGEKMLRHEVEGKRTRLSDEVVASLSNIVTATQPQITGVGAVV